MSSQSPYHSGGTAPAVLSGADEAAVEAFLAGRCRFTDIAEICADVLEAHAPEPVRSVDQALDASDAEFHDITSSSQKPREAPPAPGVNQKIIDAILDKISTSGYSALSEEEKRLLLDASRHIHPDKDVRDA